MSASNNKIALLIIRHKPFASFFFGSYHLDTQRKAGKRASEQGTGEETFSRSIYVNPNITKMLLTWQQNFCLSNHREQQETLAHT